MGQHGHAGVPLHALDQRAAAARDQQVDPAGGGEHGGDVVPVGVGGDLHAGRRQSGLDQALGDGVVDGAPAVQAVRAAAQDHRVAGLEAEPGGVGADVGAALVDHADDADRHGDATEAEPVRPRPLGQYSPGRTGQCGDVVEALRHRLDAGSRQGEAVEEGGGTGGGFDVACVGGEDVLGPGAEADGGTVQRLVAGIGAEPGQPACRVAGGRRRLVEPGVAGGGIGRQAEDRGVHLARLARPAAAMPAPRSGATYHPVRTRPGRAVAISPPTRFVDFPTRVSVFLSRV